MNDENIPVDIDYFYNEVEEAKKEVDSSTFDIYNMYHSKGWTVFENYIKSIKNMTAYSSKQKDNNESLESYAAKRLSADAVCDTLDQMIGYVKSIAENYKD
jgi:predicted GNAT superfamily acetyltransferase